MVKLRNCGGVVRMRTRFGVSLSGAAYFNNMTISRNIVMEFIHLCNAHSHQPLSLESSLIVI